MARLFIKAKDVEEKDSFQIFNQSGKPLYYTKDEFLATGHRIKIFLAETISEAAYVQEKESRGKTRFEFCARGDFGTIERDILSLQQKYTIDYNNWLLAGDGVGWNYQVRLGVLPVMTVRKMPYLIPGQALNITDTYILDIPSDADVLIALAFALAVYALNKYLH